MDPQRPNNYPPPQAAVPPPPFPDAPAVQPYVAAPPPQQPVVQPDQALHPGAVAGRAVQATVQNIQQPYTAQPVANPMPTDQQRLADAVGNAQELLCEATTVFPFMIFPDTVTIDREKFTVMHRSFFRTGDVTSIHIDDILNITANVGPLFGSISVLIRNLNQNKPLSVNYLKRSDVLRIKSIVQGYIIARQKGIDCTHMPRDELVSMLYSLGGSSSAGAPTP